MISKLTKTTFLFGCLVGGMGAAFVPLLISKTSAQTRMLPFQGRLTDAAGTSIGNEVKVLEFKMYDAPTGGTVKWSGEVHKLSVNGGLVNTMLGSKADLSRVDFSTPTYLQITVDAQADGQSGHGVIDAADPPLLPRQSVIPSIYASISGEIQYSTGTSLATVKGTDLFDASGKIKAPAIAANKAITGAQLAPAAVSSTEIADGGITTPDLADGSITSAKIGNGAVKAAHLDANAVSSGQIVDGAIQLSDLSPNLRAGVIPPGSVIAYAGITAPTGWEFCDGREVGRTDLKYSALFAVIGTFHGSGNKTTTFCIPDYRGRFLRGADDPDGDGPISAAGRDPNAVARLVMADGGNSGNYVGSVQSDEFKSHGHESAGAHQIQGANSGFWALSGQGYNNSQPDRNILEKGGDETRPKNAYVNYIIKL